MGSVHHCFHAPGVTFDGWVETGTFEGSGAQWLTEHVHPRGVTMDQRQYSYVPSAGVTALLGDSAILMPTALASLTGRLAFWLDAHYPDYYGPAVGSPTMLPLQAELGAIRMWCARPGNEAWIWADDARIYGYACDDGPLPPPHASGVLDLSGWDTTHRITCDPRDQGYLILTPRP